jgi:phospholipase C
MVSQLQNAMPQVKNIVFLMLENRSFDNLLGWLYENAEPQNVVPPASSKKYGSFDGLQVNTYWNPDIDSNGQFVTKLPGDLGQYSDQIPWYDPYEQLVVTLTWNGVMNQLFGDQNIISQLPAAPTPATMLGFLQDYYAYEMIGYEGLDILWTYTPTDLSVINGLAGLYAVSDRWFCSLPSNTTPNRAYSLCGTSLGVESYDASNVFQQYETQTIFNVLASAGKSLGLYYSNADWIDGACYTLYTFPFIGNIPQSQSDPGIPVPNQKIEINDITTFFDRAAAGTLPDFTYLEPTWGYGSTGEWVTQGTDYHPPTHLAPGEQFLYDVYEAVYKGKQWNETLLIVTFDEHGGTYDHVAPSWGAKNPDGKNGPSGFAFNLFGVRVPTILISPFVKPSTVFREPEGASNPDGLPFDHTSFIKTLLLWAGVDPETAGLGLRVPLAPTFDYVLESQQVNFAEFVHAAPKAAIVPPAPLGTPGQPLNALFEGVPFAVMKEILSSNKDFSQIKTAVERYRKHPAKFVLEMRTKYRRP